MICFWKFSLALFAQVVQKWLEENQRPESLLQISNVKLKSTGMASTNGCMLGQQENIAHSNWIRAAFLIKNVSMTLSNDRPQKLFRSLQLDPRTNFKNKEFHLKSILSILKAPFTNKSQSSHHIVSFLLFERLSRGQLS